MNIYLGNLSVSEIEERSGVTFPDELRAFMADRRQDNAANVADGKWHCFDIPFVLVCGDMDTAKEIYKHLEPMTKDFKQQLQISLSPQKAKP